jgi:hypothetical protein
MVLEIDLAVAEMVAVPTVVADVSCTCTWPPVVNPVSKVKLPKVPRSVVKVTIVPSATGSPFMSRTTAVMTVVLVPSAATADGEALRMMLAGSEGGTTEGVRVGVEVGGGRVGTRVGGMGVAVRDSVGVAVGATRVAVDVGRAALVGVAFGSDVTRRVKVG